MKRRKKALVCGMAKSGVAGAKLLYRHGYDVIINDMQSQIPGLSQELAGIEYTDALGRDPAELLDGVDLMMLSPVIPIFAPFAKKAKALGVEVIGEIELGYRFCDPGADFICISGTNGKTTTTALTGEVFKAGGRRTYVLGNIGVAISTYADRIEAEDAVVAETAALQLESIDRFHARAAGMLNITEDHLNRFENRLENYIAAKCRIFENQTEADFACLNYDDPTVRGMAKLTRAKVVYFSQKRELPEGMFLRDGRMVWRMDGAETPLILTSELKIPGAHNVENALCAAALGLCMGLEPEGVCRALRGFAGVEHRIEFVREKDGVRYINDSKATNPDSTVKAVQAMERPTVLLLGVGNYDKHVDFLPLFEAFTPNIKEVLVSGVNTPTILAAAERAGYTHIQTASDDLAEMVAQAAALARPGDTVLLSPAAASWGIYDNFEQRGEIFKTIVRGL